MQDSAENSANAGAADLLQVMATLANPHRMRVVAALTKRRNYVSRLARELGISRALLQVHLKKLVAAGLVSSTLEFSEDGKSMKFYEVGDFAFAITPRSIAAAADTLPTADERRFGDDKETDS